MGWALEISKTLGRGFLCAVLVGALCAAGMPVRMAHAELIGTERVIHLDEADARVRVEAFLGRADVQAQLRSLGVTPREAEARVAALSPAEIVRLGGSLEQLPAGGSFFGVVGAVLLVTVGVLLFTDLFGWTDVYPFIDPLPVGERR